MSNVHIIVGDLLKSKKQTLVNTVNCVGVMGKGIALEFKKRFPKMYKDYVQRCAAGKVVLGKPYLYRTETPPWVVNFPTKGHWRSVTKLADIEEGLSYLLAHYQQWGLESMAVPPLGCGLGQLEWRVVGPTLYRYLTQMEIPVELYAPHGTPHEELTPAFLQRDLFQDVQAMPTSQWIRPAWVALVEIVARIEHQPYHPHVGRTYFQKIAYVATQQGLPTGLEFVKGSYGPFAGALKPMMTRLLNNGLIREDQTGRMFQIRSGPTYPDARRAYAQDLVRWDELIDRTVDLFMRMDTHKAEVAATVLFAASQVHPDASEREVFDHVLEWKQRRRPRLDDVEVALAVRNLAALGWLDVEPSDTLPVPDELTEA